MFLDDAIRERWEIDHLAQKSWEPVAYFGRFSNDFRVSRQDLWLWVLRTILEINDF